MPSLPCAPARHDPNQPSSPAVQFDYIDETTFGKTGESLADQTLIVSLSLKQPRRSASVSAEASHYLNDPRKNHVTMFAATDVRLFKGFSFNVFGDVARIRDQRYLPKGEATPEEILVQQRSAGRAEGSSSSAERPAGGHGAIRRSLGTYAR